MGWASSWLALAAVFLCVGLVDALIDIANNAQGLWVQRRIGTSIITGLHGLWSVGAVAGGLIGSVFAGLGVPVRWHLLVTGVLFAAALLVAGHFLLPGHEPRDSPPHATDPSASATARPRVAPGVIVRLLLICLVGLAGAAGEDAGNTWGALYLTGSAPDHGGRGRRGVRRDADHDGHRPIRRRCPRHPIRSARGQPDRWHLTVLGFGVVLAVPSVVAAVVGFGIIGLGIAVLIPLAMQAADKLPGLPVSFGLAVSGWMMRVGFLLMPPLVGILADQVGLRWAFALPAAVGLLAIGCAGLLAPADRRPSHG